MRRGSIFLFQLLFLVCGADAQAPYVRPVDPAVAEKLAQWQDLKFGLLMHWGPYSQWGVVECWCICPEDEGWCRRNSLHGDYIEYSAELRGPAEDLQPGEVRPGRGLRPRRTPA